MRTIGIHPRVASFVTAVALLIQMSPAVAAGQDDNNHPVEITFTKWTATPPATPPLPPFGLLLGFAGDGVEGSFVGEVLAVASANERAMLATRRPRSARIA